MYCSSCGKSLTENLNYCNSCGNRVEGKALIVKNSSSAALGPGAVFIGIVGLVGFYPLLRELLHSSLDTIAIIVILVAYLLTVFLMFGVLIGHVWKNSGDMRIKGADSAGERATPNTFSSVNTAQLDEYCEPAMSVTDHTTRTLDKVHTRDR